MTAQSLNRLAKEKSPYLRQHQHNPVDWYPWGREAFERAAKEDKLVFLSIGYSTCHWCHVMERESFEDEEIAKLLNEHFVSIKVDREERPDIDQVYMSAVQAMTGTGGWPISIFLTPDGKPFTGGTYFPPEDRWGRSGMKTLLPRIARMWKERRGEVQKAGEKMTELLQGAGPQAPEELPGTEIFRKAFEQAEANFDPVAGGFGEAPKFPRTHDLSFLLRYGGRSQDPRPREMVQRTLDAMARGGIYDHLGGGFARYATDAQWLVPHFEKMLYDQAMISRTYLEAYQATGNSFYREVACDIFRYVLRDLRDPGGAFYSAEDADSEGVEGKFYVWRPEEVLEILGPETGGLLNRFYGVTQEGNFEGGGSILHVKQPLEAFAKLHHVGAEELRETLARAGEKLFEAREKRVRPHRDDKILTAWNGLMISSLALAGRALGETRYPGAACEAADFLLRRLCPKGRLLRRYRDGEAGIAGFQEDYAFFALGLLDLYEATLELRWLEESLRLTKEMIRLFWDTEGGGFFFCGQDAEALITRSKEYYDGATPSGNSVAATVMIRLARMLADRDLEAKAEALVKSHAAPLKQYPLAFTQLLIALDFALGPSFEIVLSGDRKAGAFPLFLERLNRGFRPRHVLLHHPGGPAGRKLEALADYLRPLAPEPGRVTAYVCRDHVCHSPTSDPDRLEQILNEAL